MSNRKSQYRDLEKHRTTSKMQKRRWRRRSGAFKYEKRRWTDAEIEAILRRDKSDRELSVDLQRSMGAIQKKRCLLLLQERS